MASLGPGTVGSVVRERPVTTAVAAVAGLGILRTAEVLAGVPLGVGALVVSTTLVLAVTLGLAAVGAPMRYLRWTPTRRRRALLVGGVAIAAVQVVAHALQVGVLSALGAAPRLVVSPVNPAAKSTAPGQVGVYLLFGVVGAAVGQELLFRGVLLGALERRLPFWWANLLQGATFGVWHLPWPLLLVLSGAEPVVSLPLYAGGLVVVTGAIGTVYGVLARTTGTVWTPVVAHLVHNVAAVAVHVRTAGGADSRSVLSAGLVAGYVALAWVCWVRWER